MHVRQQVRNAITAILKTIPEFKITGTNDYHIYESRVYPLGKEDLPAALVFSETEIIEPMTKQGQRVTKRYIETGVYVFHRANNNLENKLDPLAAKVEDAILNDQTLGGIAVQTDLSDTSLLIGGDPDAPTGAARLSFVSTVITKQGASETPIRNQGGTFS